MLFKLSSDAADNDDDESMFESSSENTYNTRLSIKSAFSTLFIFKYYYQSNDFLFDYFSTEIAYFLVHSLAAFRLIELVFLFDRLNTFINAAVNPKCAFAI